MKKVLLGIIILFIGVRTVNAESTYYINKYGVTFNQDQYNFFAEMYYEGYQEYMTKEDFNYFDKNEMNPSSVESKYFEQPIMRLSDYASGTKKTLKISKSILGGEVKITVVADWFQNPTAKSNDVIGARFVNTNLVSFFSTKIISSSGEKSYTNIDRQSNGFGQTLLISGNNIKITQTYTVKSGDTVYASYQHAKSVISAANSRKYTISADGFGGVFKFTGTAASVYDNSQGVSINV